MIYDEAMQMLPDIIYVPRIYLCSTKKLKPIQYDLILFGYRREIGYFELKCTCAGSIIIKNTLISFYDDELINSIKKIHEFLISEGLLDRTSNEAIEKISAGSCTGMLASFKA